jgi:hypothetical protein
MFRTVLMLHPSAPLHMLLCDHPMCGMQVVCALDPAAFKRDNRADTAAYIESTQLNLFKALEGDGWSIGMNTTLCPVHARSRRYAQADENAAIARASHEIEQEQAQKQSRIVPPSSSELVNITQNNGKLH